MTTAAGRRVGIVGYAVEIGDADGQSDAELLGDVVARSMSLSGLGRDDFGVVATASSEFLNGVVGSMMAAFDAFPGWPPRTHTHHDGDGAFALYEAWIRLLAGEAEAAIVCAYGRPLAPDADDILARQLDPYVVAPLGTSARSIAALQARALLESGRCTEVDLAAIACARRGGAVADVLAQPYLASPLRSTDCPAPTSGAAAVVLATDGLAGRAASRPAWITGIEQCVEPAALGARDLAASPSTRACSERLGIAGSRVDVLELHARYTHEEPILLDAVGAGADRINPSGGPLVADPLMVTGLIRIGEAADAVAGGSAARAVAHATNGPCLQHNLLCLLEDGR